jgi:hypothetical protein
MTKTRKELPFLAIWNLRDSDFVFTNGLDLVEVAFVIHHYELTIKDPFKFPSGKQRLQAQQVESNFLELLRE